MRGTHGLCTRKITSVLRLSAATIAACVAVACTPDTGGAVRPPGSTAPPAQLSTGEGYRRAVAGFAGGTAIAASNVNPDTATAKLEFLKKGKDPVVLTERGDPDSVKVALAEPATALFLDDPSRDGLGTLKIHTLDETAPKAVQKGTLVPAEGVFFGSTGAEILFVGGYDLETSRGKLFWTNGTITEEIGDQAPPEAILFDKARKVAVAGVGVNAEGIGGIASIDLKTGVGRLLVTGIVVTGPMHQPAFALSGDGKTVAFTTSEGALMKSTTEGGTPTQVSGKGRQPALSEDGSLLVYSADGKIFASKGEQSNEIAATTLALPPVISPDKKWIAYFTTFVERGAGAVGEAWSAALDGSSAPAKIGDAVAYDSIHFSPKSNRVSAVVGLQDLTGTPTYDGFGRLVYGAPGGILPERANSVPTRNSQWMELSDRLTCIGNIVPGSGVGEVLVTPDGPDDEVVKLKERAVKDTLHRATGFDSVIFLADPEPRLIDDTLTIGALYGSTLKGPAEKLQDSVIDLSFTRDGRALIVVADGEKAGIWTLPVP